MTMRDYLERKRRSILGSKRFFMPSGLSAANCLAAFQFKGVASEAAALQDLSGNGRNLTKHSQTSSGVTYTPSWNTATGFTFAAVYQGLCGYLNNASLNAQSIKCAIVRYQDMTLNNRGWLITAGGSDGLAQLAGACTTYKDGSTDNHVGPGYTSTKTSWRYITTRYTEGVVGANFGASDGLFVNGSKKTNTLISGCAAVQDQQTWHTFGNVHAPMSDLNNAVHAGKKILCAAFFDVALTADQHAEVAAAMAEI